MNAFSTLRVIDLSQTRAGAYCTKLLAGCGAEVIKVEPPQGDALRGCGPFHADTDGNRHSIPALWYHTGKKSIVLEIDDPHDAKRLQELIDFADVVIESHPPGYWENLGFGFEALRVSNPGLVMTSITGFGQTGPYRDFAADEIALYALSGCMKVTGDPAREPLNSGTHTCQNVSGMWGYIATLQALFQRTRTGRGQWVDVSMLECSVENLEILTIQYLHLGNLANRNNDHHPLVPWEGYDCKDGQVVVAGGPIRHWFRAADMFEEPALKTRKFFSAKDRMENREELEDLIRPWLSRHTRQEVFAAGHQQNLAFGMVNELPEVFGLPQHQARGFFSSVSHAQAGTYRYAQYPFRSTGFTYQTTAAPQLGQHNDTLSPREAFRRPAPTDVPDGKAGPLAGIRVLDFSTFWSAPHATRILADSGADVITVEYLGLLCIFRGGILEGKRYDNHPRWHQINRNKRSITLDLTSAKDREIACELVRQCDVVVENKRSGVMDRLGLGYESLREIRPDIIMLSLTGYGSSGPWSSYAAVGAAIEGTAGVQAMTGYPDESRRRRIKEMDICAGVMGACALMTALLQRAETGEGQWIDLSMMEAASHILIGEHLLATDMLDEPPAVQGNRDIDFAPQGVYSCRGEDAWVALSVRDDREWHELCELIGKVEWKTAPQMQSVDGRRAHHDTIDEAIRQWTGSQNHHEAMMALQRQGIPAGAVLDLAELAHDPHLTERGVLVACEQGGDERFPLPPVRMSEAALRIRRRGPDLGEHNREVIHEFLGRPLEDVPLIEEDRIVTAYHPDPEDRPVDAPV